MKIEKLNPEINSKLLELLECIADNHLVGKPAILGAGLYYSAEMFLLDQINKIEEVFKEVFKDEF